MSQQLDFLNLAIEENVAEAIKVYPHAVTAGEAKALLGLTLEDLKKLKDVRQAMENTPGINAHFGGGSGTINF